MDNKVFVIDARRKNEECPKATLTITNLTLTGQGWNLGLRRERLATNCRSQFNTKILPGQHLKSDNLRLRKHVCFVINTGVFCIRYHMNSSYYSY